MSKLNSIEIQKNKEEETIHVQFLAIIDLITNQFDIEIDKIVATEYREQMETTFFQLSRQKIHTFFSDRNIASIVQTFFGGNEYHKDFILHLSYKIKFLLESLELNSDVLVNNFKNTFIKLQLSSSLLPEKIKTQLEYDINKSVKDLLNNNFWLLVVLTITLMFEKTEAYERMLLRIESEKEGGHE